MYKIHSPLVPREILGRFIARINGNYPRVSPSANFTLIVIFHIFSFANKLNMPRVSLLLRFRAYRASCNGTPGVILPALIGLINLERA